MCPPPKVKAPKPPPPAPPPLPPTEVEFGNQDVARKKKKAKGGRSPLQVPLVRKPKVGVGGI